jgi:NAD(P)H-hydrate epimerase
MGDVLAGLIVGLLAQGLDGAEAARLAVYVHGAAADVLANEQGPVGYLASDLARAVPRRLAALRQQLPLEPRNARGRKRT